jgi:hypothetical protein
MIAGTKINFEEYFGSGQLIEENINAGQRILVFDG